MCKYMFSCTCKAPTHPLCSQSLPQPCSLPSLSFLEKEACLAGIYWRVVVIHSPGVSQATSCPFPSFNQTLLCQLRPLSLMLAFW